MKLSRRIMLSMFSVVAISGGISAVMGGYLLWRGLNREALDRVRQDLNAAEEFYRQRLSEMADALRYTALGERFSRAVADRDLAYLATRLQTVRQSASLDTLCVTDAAGVVIYRANGNRGAGDDIASDPLVAEAILSGRVVFGTILVPVESVASEDPALADRARIPLRSTAPADGGAELGTAMMMVAAAPVYAGGNKLAGVLRAGVVLNADCSLVDRVQNTVFRNETYRGRAFGSATIFLREVRIATNVLEEDRSRALGTRVSEDVYRHVLEKGQVWRGLAWAVNDWYVSAYGAIRDPAGRPIGILGVGVLERKFRDAALATLGAFLLVALGGLLAAGLIAWRLSGGISRPVQELVWASQSVAAGDFSPAMPTAGSDEIGTLGRSFAEMAQSLHRRDETLKQRTRLQLTRSERLAAVGRLAAGIAHEINNPLTGVLTFSHMLLKDAPEGSARREDLQTIIEATTRCRDIIRGLLDFSRQGQPRKALTDLNEVLREAMTLTRNQAHLNRVHVVQELDESLPRLVMDPAQIQQVAVNTVVNSLDAMGDGGVLTVRSRRAQDGRSVEFEIADTGCGIAPEILEHVFDPFFTTKPTGKGTGLGLAISYGIVAEHAGEITIDSAPGTGTTVTVRLPVEAEEPHHGGESAHPGH